MVVFMLCWLFLVDICFSVGWDVITLSHYISAVPLVPIGISSLSATSSIAFVAWCLKGTVLLAWQSTRET
jgi:hypothetical protein